MQPLRVTRHSPQQLNSMGTRINFASLPWGKQPAQVTQVRMLGLAVNSEHPSSAF